MKTSALFLSALLSLAAAPALAQDASESTPPPAPAPTGVDPEAVAAWLTEKGGGVEPLQVRGSQVVMTVHDGSQQWHVIFLACDAGRCGDAQFNARFAAPDVTVETINRWNWSNRFLKAYLATPTDGSEPQAIVQYDLLINGDDVNQLNDPTSVWVQSLPRFAAHLAAGSE